MRRRRTTDTSSALPSSSVKRDGGPQYPGELSLSLSVCFSVLLVKLLALHAHMYRSQFRSAGRPCVSARVRPLSFSLFTAIRMNMYVDLLSVLVLK